MSYDIKSTILYALGRAIETEEDFEVKLQLEDLEEKLTETDLVLETETA